jgi:rhodanese-related sulfurtransferase
MNNSHRFIPLYLLLTLFLLGCSTNSNSQNPVNDINQAEMQSMMKDPNVVVIDVRTPEEVAEGYIQGADKFINYNGSAFDTEISQLDKSKTYVIYCRSGGRSAKASQIFVDKGFTKVYNLLGGISNWTGTITR